MTEKLKMDYVEFYAPDLEREQGFMNAAFGWDGTVAGVPASEGVYYYELRFKDDVIVAVDAEDFRGSFTLLR